MDLSRLSRRREGGKRRGDVDRPHLDASSISSSNAIMRDAALDEEGAQELWDQLVQKLRIVRFLRTPDYDALFSGDPYWATECVGGIGLDGGSLVTKSSYRMLHTLTNLGPAPEPNITVLWSKHLPDNFKRYCIKVSRDTSSLQYENDDLMRPYWGDDYGIACCVSAMRLGKQMQFFGARVNLAKALLYAINGGRDEISGEQVAPASPPVTGDILDYDEVFEKFDHMMEWLARTYVHAMNCIHYMHDKYFYERLEMALHDRDILRTMAFGIAGLSVVADSLSAIKYAKVHVIRDDTGLAVDYRIEYDGINAVPQFGNNDDRVDSIAAELVTRFMQKIRKHPTYRNATHTQSVLTITSNVVYGKHTGNTPDGRRKGEPFGPGANPMHGRDSHGWLASCLSVAKLPYKDALDGISYTVSVAPQKAHLSDIELVDAAVKAFDMYFGQGGFHMNLNVIDKETLEDAMKNPDKYPQLTIRVSGYAVNFVRLTREQQLDVISRTFHGADLSTERRRCHSSARLNPEAGTICMSASRRMRRTRASFAKTPTARSVTHILMKPRRATMVRGLRVVLFVSGCLLRCTYCHNPDTWHLKDGTYVSAQDVIDRLASFAPALRALDGGLTISGGEPMVQLAFTRRIFAGAKQLGLHTAIETSGFLGDRADDRYLGRARSRIARYQELGSRHLSPVTGRELAPTLRFAERLAAIGKPVWVRFTLVPGLTDDPDNVEGHCAFRRVR